MSGLKLPQVSQPLLGARLYAAEASNWHGAAALFTVFPGTAPPPRARRGRVVRRRVRVLLGRRRARRRAAVRRRRLGKVFARVLGEVWRRGIGRMTAMDTYQRWSDAEQCIVYP